MNDERPNVLIVYLDEMRGDCLGAMGHPDLATPHLDRLAGEGALFEQAFTCYPLCTPSRAAFMTGRYPHANEVCGNHKPIGPNPVLLGSALADAGYETCYIGKLHLAGAHWPGYVAPPYRCGFEEFVGFNHGHDYFHSIQYREKDKPLHDPGFQPDIQTDLAIEFLERRRERPFCLFLSIGTPHEPCVTPKRYEKRVDPRALRLFPGTDEGAMVGQGAYATLSAREWVAEYYRQILNIDDNVGRIMRTLDERELSDDTLVLFTADHGDMCGQLRHFGKTVINYGSTSVPVIVRWPKRLPPGTRVSSLVDASIDTLPTILQACGLPIHPAIQGMSFLPVAEGAVDRTRDAIFYEYIEWHGREVEPYRPQRGIRTDRHTFLLRRDGTSPHPAPSRRELLYDRTTDPYDLENLLKDGGHEDVCRELEERIARHMRDTQDDWSIFAGEWPVPGYCTGAVGFEHSRDLVQIASPDPVLARWSGRVDRSADAEGVDLP